jgi:dienelactone hydrolase/predicted lipoprotein with Yx(FWY)xxD motif
MVLLSGCAATGPTPTSSSPAATRPLTYYDHPGLGEVLADPSGYVLYVFTLDDPNESNCYGDCARNWPPLLADVVPGGPSDVAGDLGLIDRTDGGQQVSYRDRPLYKWMGDRKPGDALGDGVNAVWFVVRRPPAALQPAAPLGEHEVAGENVTYVGSTRGFFAQPVGIASPTGVVMVHEWWGLNEHIREMARNLASHGYAVLAVDLFQGNAATTAAQAQAQVGALDQDEANRNMQAAAAFLRTQGVEEVATLGWCFGGGQALQLSLSGELLVATVIYYGSLVTDSARLDAIEWPVLGIFGEADPVVTMESARAFERALRNLSVEQEIYIYPDVGHAFANPSGDGFARQETKDAWMRTIDFLAKHTKAA